MSFRLEYFNILYKRRLGILYFNILYYSSVDYKGPFYRGGIGIRFQTDTKS